MEKVLSDIFNSLYTQFILRDLFAKIIPGFIFLLSIVFIFIDKQDIQSINLVDIIKEVSFFYLIIIMSISWLLGIFLQSIAESWNIITVMHVLNDKNKRFYDIDKWVHLRSQFIKRSNNEEKKFIERISIIKEASGINAISLLFSSIIFSVTKFNIIQKMSCIQIGVAVLIISLIFIYLLRMNYRLWKSEILFMKKFIGY